MGNGWRRWKYVNIGGLTFMCFSIFQDSVLFITSECDIQTEGLILLDFKTLKLKIRTVLTFEVRNKECDMTINLNIAIYIFFSPWSTAISHAVFFFMVGTCTRYAPIFLWRSFATIITEAPETVWTEIWQVTYCTSNSFLQSICQEVSSLSMYFWPLSWGLAERNHIQIDIIE